jgi:hypothetical protein
MSTIFFKSRRVDLSLGFSVQSFRFKLTLLLLTHERGVSLQLCAALTLTLNTEPQTLNSKLWPGLKVPARGSILMPYAHTRRSMELALRVHQG